MAVSATAFHSKLLLERTSGERPGSSPCLNSSARVTSRSCKVSDRCAASASSSSPHGPFAGGATQPTAAASTRTALHPGLSSVAQHHAHGSPISPSSRIVPSSASPSAYATDLAAGFSVSTVASARAAAAEALALARAAVAVAREAAELSLSEEAMRNQEASMRGEPRRYSQGPISAPLGWTDEEGFEEVMSGDQLRSMWALAVDKVAHMNTGCEAEAGAAESGARAISTYGRELSHPETLRGTTSALRSIRQSPLLNEPSSTAAAEHLNGSGSSNRSALNAGDAPPQYARKASELTMWSDNPTGYSGLQRAVEEGVRQAEERAQRDAPIVPFSDEGVTTGSGSTPKLEGSSSSSCSKASRVLVRSARKGKRMVGREQALVQRQAVASAGRRKKAAVVTAGGRTGESPESAQAAEDATASEYRRASNEPVYAMFDSAGGNSKLLTSHEEIEYSKGVQALLKLERVRNGLQEQSEREVTRGEWAEAAGLSTAELQSRLLHGRECKQRMVASNMRLVISVAKKYTTRGLSLEELITEGCMGLLKGVEKFDHRRGFKFSTYAHWWIRQAISRSVAEQSRIVRLPAHVYELVSRINRAKAMLTDALGRSPGDREVAELVGIPRSKLRSVMRTVKAPTSMERPIASDDGEETLGSFVADTTLANPEDGIMQKLMRRDLESALHTLTPREREVMWHRYGLDDGRVKTLEELGALFRVTRERIRQIEGKALMKLRQPGRSTALKSYIDGHAQ